MDCNIQLPKYKTAGKVIWSHFDAYVTSNQTSFGECRNCRKRIYFEEDLTTFCEHLELHNEEWSKYLSELTEVIISEELQKSRNVLKCSTICSDQTFVLHFPQSRQSKEKVTFETFDSNDEFDNLKRTLQSEYNSSPVGPYMGPYDQSDCIPMKAQLADSTLDFELYTHFSHDPSFDCKKFEIAPKSAYKNLKDLEKIDSIQFKGECKMKEDGERNDGLYYTCSKGCCEIPCCCKDCCLDLLQCQLHTISHPDNFDPKLHRRTIRSSAKFCEDLSFFKNDNFYIVNYSDIPKSCKGCGEDLLHHDAYHIVFHPNCKFCRLNRFKLRADSKKELHELIKSEEEFYESVCPYCDKTFCNIYNRNKHIQYAHEKIPFKCDHCEKTFTSLNGKLYHQRVIHTDLERVSCDKCGQTFAATISLQNHLKYAHSDVKKYECVDCGEKFKQKKSRRDHYKYVHGDIVQNELYANQQVPPEEIACDQCDLKFKYKKNLNFHIQMKHSQDAPSHFTCDNCGRVFQIKGSLTRHSKLCMLPQ